MIANIRLYIYGALAAIAAGVLVALKVLSGQRDKARDRADTAERQAAAGLRVRKKEQAAVRAQTRARHDAKENADAEADRVAAGRRPDRWGDVRLDDRMHKKD